MDRSFLGLVYSLILHVAVFVLLFNLKLPPVSSSGPTEVVLIEKDNSKKSRIAVMETHDKKDIFQQLKDQADYLSQYSKRFKKQVRARNIGRTQNSKSLSPPIEEPIAGRVGGQSQPSSPGEGPRETAPGPQLRQVAIGGSSISERIPGVEEGAFTALNTDQLTYYTFFARVNEQMRNRWVSMIREYVYSLSQEEFEKLSRNEKETVVEIILSQSGEYVRSILHRSSKVRPLDEAAIQAFQMAAPFLNPPKGLVEADGFIHLKYLFTITFRPPFGPGTY